MILFIQARKLNQDRHMNKQSNVFKDLAPYLIGALLIFLSAYLYLHLTQPEENLLPEVYGVM